MLTIQQIKETVTDYFKDKPVKKVYLFGSYARGEAKEESDVDLLVEYDESKKRLTLFDVIAFQLGLEDLFSKPVQLVENANLYYRFKPYIEEDKIEIYSEC